MGVKEKVKIKKINIKKRPGKKTNPANEAAIAKEATNGVKRGRRRRGTYGLRRDRITLKKKMNTDLLCNLTSKRG